MWIKLPSFVAFYFFAIVRSASYTVSETSGHDNFREVSKSKYKTALAKPSAEPSVEPTEEPTVEPPTFRPTFSPTKKPTPPPTRKPTFLPTLSPSKKPTPIPSFKPTRIPTAFATKKPSFSPVYKPSKMPTLLPTSYPTSKPTVIPTARPIIKTVIPTCQPYSIPTSSPSEVPSSGTRTILPISPSLAPFDFTPLGNHSIASTLAPYQSSKPPTQSPSNSSEVPSSGTRTLLPMSPTLTPFDLTPLVNHSITSTLAPYQSSKPPTQSPSNSNPPVLAPTSYPSFSPFIPPGNSSGGGGGGKIRANAAVGQPLIENNEFIVGVSSGGAFFVAICITALLCFCRYRSKYVQAPRAPAGKALRL